MYTLNLYVNEENEMPPLASPGLYEDFTGL